MFEKIHYGSISASINMKAFCGIKSSLDTRNYFN